VRLPSRERSIFRRWSSLSRYLRSLLSPGAVSTRCQLAGSTGPPGCVGLWLLGLISSVGGASIPTSERPWMLWTRRRVSARRSRSSLEIGGPSCWVCWTGGEPWLDEKHLCPEIDEPPPCCPLLARLASLSAPEEKGRSRAMSNLRCWWGVR